MSDPWYQEAVINGVAMPTYPHKDTARYRWDTFIRPLVPSETGHAIDLGCNAGFYSRELADLGYTVQGMDKDVRNAILWEANHPKGVHILHGDITHWHMAYSRLAIAACVLYWLEEYDLESLVENMRNRVATVIVMSRKKADKSHKSCGELGHMKKVFRLWTMGEVIQKGVHYSVSFHNRKIIPVRTSVLAHMSVRSNSFKKGFGKLIELVLGEEEYKKEELQYYKYLHKRAVGGRFDRYVELIKSVKEHGVLVPIKICNGRVIDGDHRIMLARHFGIESLLCEDTSVG